MNQVKLMRDIKDMEFDLEGTLAVLGMMSLKNPRCLPMFEKVRSFVDWDYYSKLSDLRERRKWLQSVLHKIQTELVSAVVGTE
jgi:hypothetical protein